MKLYLSFLFHIGLLFVLSAQNCLEVDYIQRSGINEINKPTYLSKFKSDFINSSYELDSIMNKKDTIEHNYREGNFVYRDLYIVPRYKDKKLYYMNFKRDSTYSFKNPPLEEEFVIVKETFPPVDWEIQSETDSILGYMVQRATIKFMGRNYEAWYAPEIQFSGGPRRMHGLPGLILKAASDDDYVSYDAVKIKISNQKCELKNPLIVYPKATIYTIDEYGAIIDTKMDNEVKYRKSQGIRRPNLRVYDIEIRPKKPKK